MIFGECCHYVKLWTCICCLIVLVYLRINVEMMDHCWTTWLRVYLLVLENDMLDYILLCGILSNLQWSFGWPSAYLYEWVDDMHDWFSYCLWVSWGLTLELPLYLFAWNLRYGSDLGVSCFYIYVMYLCCCWDLLSTDVWNLRYLLVMYYETWYMVVEIVICCWDIYV